MEAEHTLGEGADALVEVSTTIQRRAFTKPHASAELGDGSGTLLFRIGLRWPDPGGHASRAIVSAHSQPTVVLSSGTCFEPRVPVNTLPVSHAGFCQVRGGIDSWVNLSTLVACPDVGHTSDQLG